MTFDIFFGGTSLKPHNDGGVTSCFLLPLSPLANQSSSTFAITMKPSPDSSVAKKSDTDKNESSTKGRKRKYRQSKAPKAGEQGYKTATQLRNARKRRAKKLKKSHKQEKDPSQLFLANPKGAPIVQAAKAFFKKEHGMDLQLTMGPTRGWRTVSKLAVRPSNDDGQVTIGLFAPNSHTLIPVPDCVAHHPSINAAVAKLEKICRQTKVIPFDETSGTGNLRHVAMNVERSTGKVQMTLVWNSQPYSDETSTANDEGKRELDVLCKALISYGGASSGRKRRRGRQSKEYSTEDGGEHSNDRLELHSLWVHFNNSWKHSNSILSIDSGSDAWQHRFGPKHIVEVLDLKESGLKYPVSLRFPPNVFRQANLDAFSKIVAKIRDRISMFTQQWCRKDKTSPLPTIVELYGGVGTIGLHLADVSSSLVSSDENPFNEACFNESASDLPTNIAQRISYKPMNATAMVQNGALEGAEVIIVDPPRKGLDDNVLQALCSELSPKLLVYVSCGFAAFQRDCTALVNSKWRLDHVEGHLLFPGSDAVETLAFFVAR